MIEKIGHVRNPLSIIAIFAGLAEVSGTVVLPFIAPPIQEKFVYFLMFFPSILVVLFFITLHRRPQALYGPSDWTDQKLFANMLMSASVAEVAQKEVEEVEIKIEAEAPKDSSDEGEDTKIADIASLALKQNVDPSVRRLVEEKVLRTLSHRYDNLRRDVKIAPSNYVFDGVAQNGNVITVFEVTLTDTPSQEVIFTAARRFVREFKKTELPPELSASLVLVVVSDHQIAKQGYRVTVEGRVVNVMHIPVTDVA